MTSRRLLKAAQAIREVVSMAILTELRDPRIEGVTVTHVEVLPDMRSAKVQVSIMGSEAKQQLCLRALQKSAGFLQQCLSDRIDTRYTPRLQFSLDQGVKKSIEVSRLLRELLPAGSEPTDGAVDSRTPRNADDDLAASTEGADDVDLEDEEDLEEDVEDEDAGETEGAP